MYRSTTPHSSNLLSNHAVVARNNTLSDYLYKPRSPSDPLTTLNQQDSVTDRQPKKGVASFAKADVVLHSTATDVEITDFLALICKALIEGSPVYVPELEPETKPVMPKRLSSPPTPSTSNVFARDFSDPKSQYPASIDRGAPSRVSHLTRNTEAGSQNNYEASINSKPKYAFSITSTKTGRTERGRRREKGTAEVVESEWDNFNFDSEEDDHYAVAPKRDENKALKWLGLA
jgi:hypothetical protein